MNGYLVESMVVGRSLDQKHSVLIFSLLQVSIYILQISVYFHRKQKYHSIENMLHNV